MLTAQSVHVTGTDERPRLPETELDRPSGRPPRGAQWAPRNPDSVLVFGVGNLFFRRLDGGVRVRRASFAFSSCVAGEGRAQFSDTSVNAAVDEGPPGSFPSPRPWKGRAIRLSEGCGLR